VSEPAISVAFFDPAHGLHGSARSGVGIVFERDEPEVLAEPPALAREGAGWRVGLAGRADLAFEPLSPQAKLGGERARLCRVHGRAGERQIHCLGTVTETRHPAAWRELDATRWISALFEPAHAVIAYLRRPRGAAGHGEESTVGWLLDGEDLRSVEDARLSTVYDGEGRQRSARLELWLPGEDFPRRLTGEARSGVSLTLEGLHVHAAVFGWRMEGREGAGAYDLTVREEPGRAT
jgi:hypothetical protein